MNVQTIVEKIVFLRVRFGVLGNARRVPISTLTEGTNPDFLKLQKTLLESPELKAIATADGQMRTYLYNICLPYDMGVMILPRDLLETVNDRLVAFQDERNDLVNKFIEAYPVRVEEAKVKAQTFATERNIPLERIWRESDYKSQEHVRSEFVFDWRLMDFAVPKELPDALKEQEQAKAVAQIEKAAEEITLLMRQSLLDLVEHLKVALEPAEDGKQKRLFSSTVTNIQDFVQTFKARNITNDVELESLVGEVSKLLHPGVNTDMIKKDETFKASIYSSMTDLTSKLADLTEVVPGRKFREAA